MEGALSGLREAASAVLLREADAEPEVLLVKRRRKASFMASAWVFPGGAVDPGDGDPREAAVRELFEEAGILLAEREAELGPDGELAGAAELRTWRKRVLAGEDFRLVLGERGLVPNGGALCYFSHWITPSVEPLRFSARFYVGLCPPGQDADTDSGELDDACWLAPTAALERAGELRLPPPQIRILRDVRKLAAKGGVDEVFAGCAERAARPHPILPRAAPSGGEFALLLPWDPEYHCRGTGDLLAMPADHPLAEGPSRFILEDATWKHVDAPRFPNAG